MKKKLRAKEEFFYGGKTHKVGDHFEAVDPDANILVVTGKVEDVTSAKAPAFTQTIETRDLKPAEDSEKEAEETPAESTTTRRRQYLRRDMTSEK